MVNKYNNMVYSGFTQAGKLEEESGRTSAAAALYIEIGKAGVNVLSRET